MKSLFLAALLVPTMVFAEGFFAQKPVACDKSELVLETFSKQFGELPSFMFRGENTVFIVLVSKEKNTWTILETQGKNACMLGNGEGYSVANDLFEQTKGKE